MTIYSNPSQKKGHFLGELDALHQVELEQLLRGMLQNVEARPCWAGAAPVRAGAFPRDLRQLLFLGWKNQLNISDLVVLRSIFFRVGVLQRCSIGKP